MGKEDSNSNATHAPPHHTHTPPLQPNAQRLHVTNPHLLCAAPAPAMPLLGWLAVDPALRFGQLLLGKAGNPCASSLQVRCVTCPAAAPPAAFAIKAGLADGWVGNWVPSGHQRADRIFGSAWRPLHAAGKMGREGRRGMWDPRPRNTTRGQRANIKSMSSTACRSKGARSAAGLPAVTQCQKEAGPGLVAYALWAHPAPARGHPSLLPRPSLLAALGGKR